MPANASIGSELPYFRCKRQVEDLLKGLGVPYAIIRPTLAFGYGELLLNNMVWALVASRCSPSTGTATTQSSPSTPKTLRRRRWRLVLRSDNSVADAAGPDTLVFEALLRLLASAMGVHARLVHTPSSVGLALTRLVGLLMRDVALTRERLWALWLGC